MRTHADTRTDANRTSPEKGRCAVNHNARRRYTGINRAETAGERTVHDRIPSPHSGYYIKESDRSRRVVRTHLAEPVCAAGNICRLFRYYIIVRNRHAGQSRRLSGANLRGRGVPDAAIRTHVHSTGRFYRQFSAESAVVHRHMRQLRRQLKLRLSGLIEKSCRNRQSDENNLSVLCFLLSNDMSKYTKVCEI